MLNKEAQQQTIPIKLRHQLHHQFRRCSAETRHLVSEKRVAFRGLFTSGIKSAHDIETSGWMKLSQGAGTGAGIAPTTQHRNPNLCYIQPQLKFTDGNPHFRDSYIMLKSHPQRK